jgi:ribonuclease III
MASAKRKSSHFNALNRKLGYRFKRENILEKAFRHASYVNEREKMDLGNNERLEFLGDAVLDLAVSHILMDLFEEVDEGELSKYRASVVNEGGLCRVARKLQLGDYMLLGKGEELTQGREKPSILANTMEALLGALYLDAGFDRTKEIIQRLFMPLIERVHSDEAVHDFKSILQEHTQEIYKQRPEYRLVEQNGPAHDRTFRVSLHLEGRVIAGGEGKSKKEAEQRAAREAFFCLKQKEEDL